MTILNYHSLKCVSILSLGKRIIAHFYKIKKDTLGHDPRWRRRCFRQLFPWMVSCHSVIFQPEIDSVKTIITDNYVTLALWLSNPGILGVASILGVTKCDWQHQLCFGLSSIGKRPNSLLLLWHFKFTWLDLRCLIFFLAWASIFGKTKYSRTEWTCWQDQECQSGPDINCLTRIALFY